MTHHGAIIVATALCLLACNPIGKIVDSHREAASAQLARLTALAPKAREQAPMTDAGFTDLPGGTIDFRSTEKNSNARAVFLDDLEHPCAGGERHWVDARFKEQNYDTRFTFPLGHSDAWLQQPACLLGTGKGSLGVEVENELNTERGFADLEHIEYLLIVRINTIDSAVIVELSDAQDDTTFAPGKLSGDVLLYNVASGELLGGFPVDATNSESFDTTDLANAALRGDISKNFVTIVRETFSNKVPGSFGPG